MKVLFTLPIIGILIAALSFPHVNGAEERVGKIRFFTIYGWGKYTDSQYLNLFKEAFSEVLKTLKIEGEFNHFVEEEAFFKALKGNRGPSLAQVGNVEQMIKTMRLGYRPVITYSFQGLKANRLCLYVKEDSSFKKVKDLKGKTLTMSKNLFEYTKLRELLGEAPELFFSGVDLTGDGDAPAYAFYMEHPDALFITVQQVKFLELNNPQTVKGNREIGCTEDYALMAMLAPPEITDSLVEEMVVLLNRIGAGERVQKFYPLLKYLKVKAYQADVKQYAPLAEAYEKAVEKGWDDDYRKLAAPEDNSEK